MDAKNPLKDSMSNIFVPDQGQDYSGKSWAEMSEGLASEMGNLNLKSESAGGLNPNDDVAEIEVKKSGDGSHLFAATTWEQLKLRQELLDSLAELRFLKPSKIQAAALPYILGRNGQPMHNVIGQARSGSGKTGAFSLGFLEQVTPDEYPQVVVIAPTQELCAQIRDEIHRFGSKMKWLTIFFAVKDTKPPKEKVKAQVVVGTPDKIWNFASLATTAKFFPLKDVKVFVLDEADNVIAGGMKEASLRVKSKCKPNCQTLFFSATFPQTVTEVAQSIVQEPKISILLRAAEVTVTEISQFYVKCRDDDAKYSVLDKIYSTLTIGQTIIFVDKIATCDWLFGKLQKDGHTVVQLHGKLEPDVRRKIMQEFREGKTSVMIATNVAARGIDVAAVSMVVNYDLPLGAPPQRLADVETYIHRIGRTGRMGKKGIALSFVTDNHALQVWDTICKAPEMAAAQVKELPADDSLFDVLDKLQKELQSSNRQ